MESVLEFLNRTFSFNLGSLSFAPSYMMAGAVVILLFLLVLVIASMRRHMVGWSMKGAVFGIFFGFLLALILEGFLILGGKTALTEVLGWKNAPKPIMNVLDIGKSKMVTVLGLSTDIPSSSAKGVVNKEQFVKLFQSLTPDQASGVKKIICQ